LAAALAARGATLERLNLRLPSFSSLRVSAMIEAVQAAIGGPDERVVLIGSSLGGFVAAQLAAIDPRVSALVLLAPAFELETRWRQRLGESGWRDWAQRGWLETLDHTTGKLERVDYGFLEDLRTFDQRGLPELRVPTLILHGKQDEVVDISLSRRLVAGRPHLRLIELEDGHELVASLPRIEQELATFLSGFLGPQLGPPSSRRAYSVAVYPRRGERLLLIRHRRLGVWLPPGGECLAGELPLEAARRELFEETALRGRFPITSAIAGTPAGLIGYEEHVAGSKGTHLNFVFVADVDSDEVVPNDEFEDWRWVSLDDGPWGEAPPNVRQLAVLALQAPAAEAPPVSTRLP
jgi:8-oxo-dGTP pyrophosphatase MutT (NUDIX family)/predicted alpha/beta hydrolase family esterase